MYYSMYYVITIPMSMFTLITNCPCWPDLTLRLMMAF